MATKKTKPAEADQIEVKVGMNQPGAMTAVQNDIAALPLVDLDMLESMAGEGLEGADSQECFGIPYVTIVQSNSPELVEGTVEGIRQGQFMNSVTKEVYDEIEFIPCTFERRFKLWAPRSTGGGFKGIYNPADVALGTERIPGFVQSGLNFFANVPAGQEAMLFDQKGKPKYDELKDSRDHFVLFRGRLNGEEWSAWFPAVMSMTSTQIKKSKALLTMIRNAQEISQKTGLPFTPPSFARIYKATTTGESNADGSWFGWVISFARKLDDTLLFTFAKKFRDEVSAGAVIVQEDSVNNNHANTEAF